MHLLSHLTDYENSESFVNRLRNQRLRFFDSRLKALGLARVRILDVGGYERFWIARGFHLRPDVDITLLNLQAEETHSPNMRSVAGDACDMPQFSNGEFDVVFSNSVIEHLHTLDRQQAMAREVLRVGRHHFVQTPNRYFPIEPHYLLPAFQFLPRGLQQFVLTRTRLSRGTRMTPDDAAAMIDEIRLLSGREFRRLFPTSRMYEERLMGLTKSFTAYSM
jgi:2-polyprenyl-3-methyl-5-hydroxy-6-metoxy-1,4-benzoquinol methylase